jgi:hypothetical protein
MPNPDIPKRLAAKIKAAQAKVKDKRRYVLSSERNHERNQEVLDEYDSDPGAYAANHYSNKEWDSYPVQTRIGKYRDKIDRHQWRHPERIQELAEAEAALMRLEAEILVEVLNMRPSSGRVPWPRKLPKWTKFVEAFEAEMEREEERWRRANAIRDREIQDWLAKEDAKIEAYQRESEEMMRRDLAKMTPEQYARWRAFADRISNAIKTGEIGATEILQMARGDWPKIL